MSAGQPGNIARIVPEVRHAIAADIYAATVLETPGIVEKQ